MSSRPSAPKDYLEPSSEMDAIIEFQKQEGIDQDAKQRILSHNPKALYGL